MGAFGDADTGNIRKRQAWDTDWKQHSEILLLTYGTMGRLLQMLAGSIYKAALINSPNGAQMNSALGPLPR